MNIDSIQNGIVIDHIKAGKSMDMYRFLQLDQLSCSVAIIKNVNSRKNHVALITGSVEVSTGNTSHRQLLAPGQSASLADGGRLIVECENMESYVYWRNGYIYFDDATLTEIAQQLGRWFNVDVEVKNAQKQHLRLHFLYKRSDSMKRVVSILNNFGEFKAEYSNNCLRIK